MIMLSIDVTLLDKARFKEVTRKNGKKAVFCDIVLFEAQSEYGDWIAKQGVTKEEREAKLEMPILGNGKNLGGGAKTTRQAAPSRTERAPQEQSDGCPF